MLWDIIALGTEVGRWLRVQCHPMLHKKDSLKSHQGITSPLKGKMNGKRKKGVWQQKKATLVSDTF